MGTAHARAAAGRQLPGRRSPGRDPGPEYHSGPPQAGTVTSRAGTARRSPTGNAQPDRTRPEQAERADHRQNRPRIESGRQAGLDYPQPRTVVIGSGEWLKRWLASCDALTTADIRRGNSGFTEQFQIGDGGNRTHDLRIKSPMLYRLSYVSVVVI